MGKKTEELVAEEEVEKLFRAGGLGGEPWDAILTVECRFRDMTQLPYS